MNNRALTIFNNVLSAMQDADEIEGVEGNDYISLMVDIAMEADRRMNNCIDNMAFEHEALTNGER